MIGKGLQLPVETQIHLAAGVYNADPEVGEDGEHGVDFRLNPEDGVLAIAEAGYAWDAGLPGSVTFGGYLDSSDYDDLDGNGRFDAGRDSARGLRLVPVEPYGWRER